MRYFQLQHAAVVPPGSAIRTINPPLFKSIKIVSKIKQLNGDLAFTIFTTQKHDVQKRTFFSSDN